MALSLGDLEVTLGADTSPLRRAEREVRSTTETMGRSFSRLGGFIAAAFSLEAIRRITLASDQLSLMQRRLVRFTGDANSAEKTFVKLSRAASRTGQEIGNVTSIFERFSLIRDEIGATNEQIVLMTETLSKLGVIGGSTSEEVSNALRQLAQGLAGGVIRAEEFNSIMEQTPEIAKTIGEQMGLSMGELRKAMLEGELTSSKVFAAILRSSSKVNDEFDKMPKSISQAAQALENELLVSFNKLDDAVGFSSAIANFFSDAAEDLSLLNKTGEETLQTAHNINVLSKQSETLTKRIAQLKSTDEEANKVEREHTLPLLEKRLELTNKLLEANKKKLESQRFEPITITITEGQLLQGPASPSADQLDELANFLSMRATLTSDANLELEAEFRRHQAAIADSFEEGSEEFMTLQKDLSTWRTNEEKRAEAERFAVMSQGLSNLANVFDSASGIISEGMKQGNAAAKAAFIAMKAIQVAQIIAATEASAAIASTAVAPAGPFAWLASQQGIRATGYASAGLVAGLSVGESVGAFENGGIVPGTSFSGDNLLANVNSGEMIINHSQQRKLFEMANGQGGGSGPMSVNVINNGAPLEVQSSSMSNGELTLMVDNKIAASENRINRSLSSGRGATAQSLQKGFNAERRL